MSEPVWKVRSVQSIGDDGDNWNWLYYEIEDHRGDEVEMSVIVEEDGSIYEVLITTERGAYMFFGNGAEGIFDFVEKELLGSVYPDDRCDIEEEVNVVDNS
jgi:hypothetical protein